VGELEVEDTPGAQWSSGAGALLYCFFQQGCLLVDCAVDDHAILKSLSGFKMTAR
jgi:hypothetical protein